MELSTKAALSNETLNQTETSILLGKRKSHETELADGDKPNGAMSLKKILKQQHKTLAQLQSIVLKFSDDIKSPTDLETLKKTIIILQDANAEAKLLASNNLTFADIESKMKEFQTSVDKLKQPVPKEVVEWDQSVVYTGYNKYVPFPLKNGYLESIYDRAKKHTWLPEDIDYASDRKDFLEFSEPMQRLLTLPLAQFARTDGLVNENLVSRFIQEVDIPEAKLFYSHQIFMESIHAITYALLVKSVIYYDAQVEKILKDSEMFRSVKQKEDWAKKWIDNDTSPFAERLLAFVCVEGIFFAASFCVIFWFKSFAKGKLPGVTTANLYIFKDESFHCLFACALYDLLKNKLSEEKVHQIFKEAVACEQEFVKETITEPLPGMTQELMLQYIQYVSDYWLKYLGYATLYNVENPFQFMKMMELPTRNNFFERRSTEYNFTSSANEGIYKLITFTDVKHY